MKILLALCYFASLGGPLLAHPGGIDHKGGHFNEATGTYHYHRDRDGRQLPKPLESQEATDEELKRQNEKKDEPRLEAPAKKAAKVKEGKKKGSSKAKGKKGKTSKASKKGKKKTSKK